MRGQAFAQRSPTPDTQPHAQEDDHRLRRGRASLSPPPPLAALFDCRDAIPPTVTVAGVFMANAHTITLLSPSLSATTMCAAFAGS